MVAITVFDPVQGCASGLCGSELADAMANFAVDLEWLQAQGVEVRRFNLGHDPAEFATNPVVRGVLMSEGMAGLPLTLIGDEVIAASRYPGRTELCEGLRRSKAFAADSDGTG